MASLQEDLWVKYPSLHTRFFSFLDLQQHNFSINLFDEWHTGFLPLPCILTLFPLLFGSHRIIWLRPKILNCNNESSWAAFVNVMMKWLGIIRYCRLNAWSYSQTTGKAASGTAKNWLGSATETCKIMLCSLLMYLMNDMFWCSL
mgnify:CR=1 FL=1